MFNFSRVTPHYFFPRTANSNVFTAQFEIALLFLLAPCLGRRRISNDAQFGVKKVRSTYNADASAMRSAFSPPGGDLQTASVESLGMT